jgi:hypothetical protein
LARVAVSHPRRHPGYRESASVKTGGPYWIPAILILRIQSAHHPGRLGLGLQPVLSCLKTLPFGCAHSGVRGSRGVRGSHGRHSRCSGFHSGFHGTESQCTIFTRSMKIRARNLHQLSKDYSPS